MDDELAALIKRCQSTDAGQGYQYLNTITDPPTPIWIRTSCLTDLMTGYCDIVSRRPGSFYLAEAPKPEFQLPLMVQGLFRFSGDISTESLNFIVHTIIARYQRMIKDRFNVSATQAETLAIYLGSWSSVDHTFRYRIQFPYIRVDPNEQHATMRDQLIREISIENPWKDLPMLPISGWDTQIDPKPYKWITMVGSRDRRGVDPLEFINVYGEIVIGGRNFQDFTDAEIQDYLENQMVPTPEPRHSLIVHTIHPFMKVLPARAPSPSVNFDWWLPVFCSIYYGSGTILTLQKQTSLPTRAVQTSYSRSDQNRFTDFNIAIELMETCLKEVRAQEDFYFNDIGRALHHITHGSEEGYRKWIEWGEPRGANIRGKELMWNSMEYSGITMKTIMFYARHDNEDTYKLWHKDWVTTDMAAACGGGHSHVAKALYKTFCLKYVCAAVSNTSWYVFNDNHWSHIDKGYSLSIALTEEFVQLFDLCRKKWNDDKIASQDASMKSKLEWDIMNVTKIIAKLADNTFKTKVLNEALNYFYDPYFADHFDNLPHLFCARSCVFEMRDGRILTRDGKPEDYLTMESGVKYDPRLTMDSMDVREALTWMNQLMVDPTLVKILKKKCGSLLYGGNLDKTLDALTGPPDAGKSTFIRALCMALGKYAVKGDNGVLFGNRSGDGPSPSLARLRGVRVQIFEELETERGSINSGFVKRATGNDSFFARFLNQNGGEVHPLFKTFFVCNDIPAFSTFEPAMRQRLFPIPFGSRWLFDAPADPNEQMRLRIFKRERYFDSKLPGLARALLWLMVQWYTLYHDEGIQRMEIIENTAAKYWAGVDYYFQFGNSALSRQLLPDGQTR